MFKYLKQKNKNDNGFTIIETMISISIFLIVLTIGMNSLLNASFIHQKSRDQRSLMDSLSFMMEDMSRSIRTGYNFRCVEGNSFSFFDVTNQPRSCSSVDGGGVIVFENAAGDPSVTSDQWVYLIESLDGGTTYNIYKSTDGGTTKVPLNSSEIIFDPSSRFYITGAEADPGDTQQPLISIVLKGKINYKGVDYPFSLQSTVSQRTVAE